MTTRMLHSLKRTCTEEISQGWVRDVTTEFTLGPLNTPRIVRGSTRFSNPAQVCNAATIRMEVIYIGDKRFRV